MVSHPGRRITFYDMAGIFGTAFMRIATPDKAIHGFKCSGLWPFDPTVFSDDDFQGAAVTEEAQPVTSAVTLQSMVGGAAPPPVPDTDPAGAPPVPVADPAGAPPVPVADPAGAPPVPVADPAGAPPVPDTDPACAPPVPVADPAGAPPVPVADPAGATLPPVSE